MTATGTRHAGFVSADARRPESFWISLRYFNLYRMAVAVLFFGATFVYEGTFNLGSRSIELFRYVSFGYLFLGIVFQAGLRNLRDRFNSQLSAHVFADIAAITLLLNASGGLSSGLGVMVLVSLTGAALVAPQRLTYLYAAVATIALLLEQTYWVLVHDAPTANYLQPGLLAIGYFASAGVTGWLAQRVAANEMLARRRGRELGIQMRINQLVIEELHDGVMVLDGGGRIVQHNPQAKRMVGAEPLLGMDVTQALPGFVQPWREWSSGSAPIEPASADVEVRGKGIRARLLDAGSEEEGYSVLFLEDITRSREQAQQLKLAALGRITANIAHEIRNPLAAISHAAELIAEERRGPDRDRLTQIINDNARRLDRLVSDVMQLNRRDRMTVERIALNSWLKSFIEEFASNESTSQERIAVDTQADVAIAFDRDHLRQVMWNLLRNAIRHARPEPRSVRIVLRSFARQVELSVIDNGPGVPASAHGQLFEPFFTTDSKGTGLGLYLARELCAANRAVLEYVSDMPGAHFRILCEEAGPA
jgi:two-component system sensor histidine kinase PilS (NtrC family)